MKRKILKTCVIALAAFMLAGCGQKEEEPEMQLKIVAEPLPNTGSDMEAVAESVQTANDTGTDADTEQAASAGADTPAETVETPDAAMEQPAETPKIQPLEGPVGEWGSAYVTLVKQAMSEDDDKGNRYGWIYFDSDDVPELVIGRDGYWVCLYTYRNGKAFTLMDHWAYGAAGNAGYEYLPKKNLLRNYNTDYAGLVLYTTYMELNDTPELVQKYYVKTAYEDENGEVLTPESADDMVDENWHFYVAEGAGEERRLSTEEMSSYLIREEFNPIQGTMTAEQILGQLQ